MWAEAKVGWKGLHAAWQQMCQQVWLELDPSDTISMIQGTIPRWNIWYLVQSIKRMTRYMHIYVSHYKRKSGSWYACQLEYFLPKKIAAPAYWSITHRSSWIFTAQTKLSAIAKRANEKRRPRNESANPSKTQVTKTSHASVFSTPTLPRIPNELLCNINVDYLMYELNEWLFVFKKWFIVSIKIS